MLSLPDQVAAGMRLYRNTPARLRRPEPAMRLGVTAVSVWFTLLFGALAIFTTRTGAGAAFHRGSSWAWGYAGAALLGPIGLALFLTRRHRAGLGALGAMFLLGQLVTLAAVM